MSPATVERLIADGHDVEWVGAWTRDPGDREILMLSREAERVLVTTDRGFGAVIVASPTKIRVRWPPADA